MSDFSIHVPAAAMRAALVCVSTEETRFYLNGVHVEPLGHEVAIVSTDGHRLFAARFEPLRADFEAMPDQPLIIPRDAVKKALTGYKGENIMIRREGDSYLFGDISFRPVDGTFPDWRRVLPSDTLPDFGKLAQFNPAYLADVEKVGKALIPGRHGPAKPYLHHMGDGPAVVTFSDIDLRAVMLIMPWRAEAMPRSDLRITLDVIRAGAPDATSKGAAA